MGWRYPLDIADLVARLKKRGDAYADMLAHIASVQREDEKLSVFAWEVSRGWFPMLPDRKTFHSGMDIGLRDGGGDSFRGAPVCSIGDGTVFHADEVIAWSASKHDFGRVIVQHPTPEKNVFAYALYMQLGAIDVRTGDKVKEGDVIGKVGWGGNFHHLHFAIASQKPLGGECPEQMVEVEAGSWPEGDELWNVLRVKTPSLDPNEWIGMGLLQGPFYLINPVEFVRAMRKQEYSHYNGVGSPHTFVGSTSSVSVGVSGGEAVVRVGDLLRHEPFKANARLMALAQGSGHPLKMGDEKGNAENKEAIRAAQEALIFSHYLDLRPELRGTFGKGTLAAVKKFQKVEIDGNPKMISMLEKLGRPRGPAVNGTLDRYTLLALDSFAAAHVRKKAGATAAPPAPPPDADEEPERPPEPPPPPPPAAAASEGAPPPLGPWPGFDATKLDPATGKPRLSIRFGLRLYKALLAWELVDEQGKLRLDAEGKPTGCFYSINGTKDQYPRYGEHIDDFFQKVTTRWKKHKDGKTRPIYSEWPRVDLFIAGDPRKRLKLGDSYNHLGKALKHLPEYHVYESGVSWVANGFTNCCNSQYAAFFVACDGIVKVKLDGSTTKTYSLLNTNTGDRIGGQEVAGLVQKTIMGNSDVKDASGSPVQADRRGYGLAAMLLLKAGDAVHGDGKRVAGKKGPERDKIDQPMRKKVLLGDWGNWEGHHFLVSDVMYRIRVKVDAKKTADYFVTQSRLVFKKYTDLTDDELTQKNCAVLLKRQDLDALDRDEAGFTSRVQQLVSDWDKAGATFKNKPIAEFRVADVAIFTANAAATTLAGEICDVDASTHRCTPNGAKNAADAKGAKGESLLLRRGITREFRGMEPTSYGRWYGPVE